jgi:cell division protein FtsI/penicillin-binding protein 2
MSSKLSTGRIRFLTAGAFLFAVLILTKLYFVQIVHGEQYKERADRQYLRPQASIFDRGSISFENKDGIIIDAATLKTGYTVAIKPKIINEPADIFNNLSFVLDIDFDEFEKRVSKSDDPYEEIAKKISEEDAQEIAEYDLNGVDLVKDRWRYYPGDYLASHLLGFVSYNKDELRGQYGLERYYNDVLAKDKDQKFANFFVEIFRGIGDRVQGKDLKGSIITTIEPQVQTFIEKEIDQTTKKWNSNKTGAIIMNPNNGEVYAMALNPTFDLNTFNKVDNVSIYNNDLVESVYEMGSIVKPLTFAIGMDQNKITAETTYEDKGSITLNGRTFYNFDKQARGIVTMQEVMNKSLNTGVAFIVDQVGKNVFADYMKKLIGDVTGIDLPNEVSPQVANLDSPRDIEYATASFGQGIAISPIVATKALAALGNGGYIVNPHIVKRIDYDAGFSRDVTPNPPERIFSEKTSEDISRVLVTAVDEALLGGTASLPNHSVAAKTGTAQIANQVSGGYYDDRYLHSFFGYFPAYDPEFIVFLYTVEPKGAQYASDSLTEPFFNIAEFLINYYEIPPDR